MTSRRWSAILFLITFILVLAVSYGPATGVETPEIRNVFDELWETNQQHLNWFDPGFTGPLPEISAP